MLTSPRQYKASVNAIEKLESIYALEPSSKISKSTVEANRNKVRSKINKIKEELEEYKLNISADVKDIEIYDFHSMLVSPIKYRLAMNMTVKEFSDFVKISKRQIIRYEEEEYMNCSIPNLYKIINLIGLIVSGSFNR